MSNAQSSDVLSHDNICFKQTLNSRVLEGVGPRVLRNIANLSQDMNAYICGVANTDQRLDAECQAGTGKEKVS